MKDQFKWIWIVASCLALWLIWRYPNKWPWSLTIDYGDDYEVVNSNQHQIDSLKGVIQFYEKEQQAYDAQIKNLEDSVVELQYSIRSKENKIAQLKKETNEKANNVVKFNTSDIYKFLSDRYKVDSTRTK